MPTEPTRRNNEPARVALLPWASCNSTKTTPIRPIRKINSISRNKYDTELGIGGGGSTSSNSGGTVSPIADDIAAGSSELLTTCATENMTRPEIMWPSTPTSLHRVVTAPITFSGNENTITFSSAPWTGGPSGLLTPVESMNSPEADSSGTGLVNRSVQVDGEDSSDSPLVGVDDSNELCARAGEAPNG